jgi:ribonuclease P protein subunit POP4
MRPRGELRRHELIGLNIEVVSSTHPGYVGLRGRVVDETRHMLVIEVDGVEKKVPKAACVFEFDDHGRKERIRGSEIEFKPEDRIKRVR